jgi:TP901 family phage tail tape measure protein
MPASDYRVRFVGDLGNLAQFSSSIRGAYSSISGAYRTAANSPVASIRSPSLQTGGLTTTIDAYNRTLTQSGQVFHRYVSGYVADMKRLEVSSRALGVGGTGFNATRGRFGSFGTRLEGGRAVVSSKDVKPTYENFFTGQYKEVTANLDKVEAAQRRLIPLERQLASIEKQRVTELSQVKALLGNNEIRKTQLQTIQSRAMQKLEAKSMIAGGTVGHMVLDPAGNDYKRLLNKKIATPSGMLPLFADDADLQAAIGRNVTSPDPRIQQGLASIRKLEPIANIYNLATAELATVDTAITGYQAEEQRVINRAGRKTKAAIKAAAPKLAALEDALNNSVAPISKDLDYLLQNSKSFRKNFVRQLGIKTPYLAAVPDAPAGASLAEQNKVRAAQARVAPVREAFSRELLSRGITPDSVRMTYDYERGMYGVTAAVNGLNGAQGRLSATFDRNLNQVETNSRSLRGYGGFLRQTGKDLQKVLEWTVATTLVFGTLGLAIGSISKINQVNMDLERFAIAAKTSKQETEGLFQAVSEIAQDTATPLTELTAVMDDIAIATRKAGQTTEQWHKSIKDLTQAVGILTNLTGVDTVRATDLLSAAYKQLQIQPSQIISVLNKVTAVAGGNAKSIEDITAALGSVSTAAQAAGLNLDEQIASVQVLSQVTNKSSSDLATSFKNLFGAISSPGSVKILEKFGIAVREANGELRPFLEIYKDIYDARQSGQISDGNFQDVLRGISGGPRRAPDAAALVENMPLIWEQLAKSVNSSNEALIANARIIETNSAKLQKIRSAFDATLVENFTDTVNKLVSAIVVLGEAFTGTFGDMDVSGLISGVTQLGLMIAAMIALNKFIGPGGIIRRGITGLRGDFQGLISAEGSFAAQYAKSQIVRLGQPTGGALPAIPGLRVVGPSGIPKPMPRVQALPAGYNPPAPGALGPHAPLGFTPTGKIKKLPPRVGYDVVGPLGNQQYVLKPAPGFKVVGTPGNQTYVPNPTPAANQRYEITTPAVGKLPKDYNPKKTYTTLTPIKGYEIKPDANGNPQYHLKPVKGFDVVGPVGNQRLVPQTPVPRNVVVQRGTGIGSRLAAESALAKNRLLGSSTGRMALGAGAGALAAGALGGIGAIAGGDTLGTVATIGQGIGPMLMLLGGPAGIAAGAALTVLSTGLAMYNEEQQKTIEKQKALKLSIFDEIKALQEQRRAVMTASDAQKAAGVVRDGLLAKTELTAEETNQLTQANKSYIDASFDLIDANSAVATSMEKLMKLIPELEGAYGGLTTKALQGFKPEVLKNLSSELAQEILNIQLPGTKLRPYTPITNQPASTVIDPSSIFGPMSASDFISRIQSPRDAVEWLAGAEAGFDLTKRGLGGKSAPGGFEFNKDVADALRIQLSKEEAKDIENFDRAVEQFGLFVDRINLPTDQLQASVASTIALVQGQTSVGLLSGKANDTQKNDMSTNAAARTALANLLLDPQTIRSLTSTETRLGNRPLGENAQSFNLSNMATALFGSDSVSGLIGETSLGLDITMEKAEEMFAIFQKTHPEVAQLKSGTEEFSVAAVKLLGEVGYSVVGVSDHIRTLAGDFEELTASIQDSVTQAVGGLYDQLTQLRARKAGGEFDLKGGGIDKRYSVEKDQIYALIDGYKTLGAVFEGNAERLDEYRTGLSEIVGLEKLQYVELNQVLPTLMDTAVAMGLNSKQIDKLIQYTIAYIAALDALDKIEARPKITLVTSVVTAKSAGGAAAAASLNAIARAQAKQQSDAEKVVEDLMKKIANIFKGGAGTSFNQTPASSGGGGGSSYNKPGLLDVPEEFKTAERSVASLLAESVKNARKLQSQIPGETKANKGEVVAILNGTKKVLQTKGIGEEYLRRAMEELTDEIKKQNELLLKTDKISRIRVGAGSFAAIANVPVSAMGISTGGPGQPINVNLNVNGQILTPAQLDQLANLIAAQIKRGYA